MAKTATETSTKTATKSANAKTTRTKKDKVEKADKPKRQPTAYNLFMKDNLQKYRSENEGMTVKEAMAQVAKLWRDAPENPNRGKDPKAKKPKPEKENGEKKTRSKKAAPKQQVSSETEEQEEAADSDE